MDTPGCRGEAAWYVGRWPGHWKATLPEGSGAAEEGRGSCQSGGCSICCASDGMFWRGAGQRRWLGEIRCWSKAQILLLGAAGAGPSPKHVLDIGAYGGGSALHLAMALPGVHVTAVELDPVMVALARCLLGFAGVGDRVRVLPGHTRFRLPGLQGQRFSGIFADVWGAQYADVLALIHRHALLSTGSVLIADNVLRTGAAEFAGRVTGPGFHTVVMPVREVANPEEEDWMTVSVLRDAAAWETSVSEELLELQARSEHLRDEATNEGIAPEEHQDFSERAREVFRKVGIAPVSP